MPATPWNRAGKTRCLPSRNFHSSGKVTPRQIRSLPPPLFALVYSYNHMNTTSDWPEGSLCFRSQVTPPICCHILPPLTQGEMRRRHGPLGCCLTTGGNHTHNLGETDKTWLWFQLLRMPYSVCHHQAPTFIKAIYDCEHSTNTPTPRAVGLTSKRRIYHYKLKPVSFTT